MTKQTKEQLMSSASYLGAEAADQLFPNHVPEEVYLAKRGRNGKPLSKRQAQRERAAGRAPSWFKIGRQVYYSIPGSDAYAASQEVKPLKNRRG